MDVFKGKTLLVLFEFKFILYKLLLLKVILLLLYELILLFI